MATANETPSPTINGELINRVQQLRLSDQLGTGRGASRGSWLPWVLCGIMAITWAGVGVRWYRVSDSSGERALMGPRGAPGATGPSPTGGTPSPAGTNATQTAPGELILQIKGTLTPFVQLNLSPIDVSGEVTEINFKEGDRVKQGQLLAKIRDARFLNDATSASANVLGAKAQLARAEATEAATRSRIAKAESMEESANARVTKARATVVQATLDLERAQNTVTSIAVRDDATAKKAIAEADEKAARADVTAATKEVEALKADLLAATAGIQAAAAEVTGAKARKDEADRILENCSVLAPISGTILTKSVERGALVSPMSFNVAAGICTMADLSDLEAEIDVPEKQIARIKPGLDCQVAADADPSRIYSAYIDRIMPIADDSKNIIKVRVKVKLPPGEEPGSFLKPKMSSTVTVYNRPFGEKKK